MGKGNLFLQTTKNTVHFIFNPWIIPFMSISYKGWNIEWQFVWVVMMLDFPGGVIVLNFINIL